MNSYFFIYKYAIYCTWVVHFIRRSFFFFFYSLFFSVEPLIFIWLLFPIIPIYLRIFINSINGILSSPIFLFTKFDLDLIQLLCEWLFLKFLSNTKIRHWIKNNQMWLEKALYNTNYTRKKYFRKSLDSDLRNLSNNVYDYQLI